MGGAGRAPLSLKGPLSPSGMCFATASRNTTAGSRCSPWQRARSHATPTACERMGGAGGRARVRLRATAREEKGTVRVI